MILMRRVIALIILFYFLALFQTSFLVHFKFKGGVLNLVLVFIILISFFEQKEKHYGFLSGIIGGLYLDIFSSIFFGLFTLLAVATSLLIKIVKPFFETKKFISFFIILFSSLLFYQLVLALITLSRDFYFNIFTFLYNCLAGLIIYFLAKLFYAVYQEKIKKVKD